MSKHKDRFVKSRFSVWERTKMKLEGKHPVWRESLNETHENFKPGDVVLYQDILYYVCADATNHTYYIRLLDESTEIELKIAEGLLTRMQEIWE